MIEDWDPAAGDEDLLDFDLAQDDARTEFHGPFVVVRCTEAGDYTSPRGETLDGEPYVFPTRYAGGGVYGVTEGRAYAVDANGRALELLE